MSDNSPMLPQPKDDAPELSGARPMHCGKPMRRFVMTFEYTDSGERTTSEAWGCVGCGRVDVDMMPARAGTVVMLGWKVKDQHS